MCLVFFAFASNPQHPLLLLASNRDEYFQRPTKPLHFWQDVNGLLAGRDLDGGGTWLGINAQTGRVAFLTNLRSRDPIAPSTHEQKQHSSRGELTTNFLTGTESPLEFAQSLCLNQYHGFNLVLGDLSDDPRVGSFVYTHNGRAEASSSRTNGTNVAAAVAVNVDGQLPLVEDGVGVVTSGSSSSSSKGAEGRAVGGGISQSGSSCSEHILLLEPGCVYGLSNGQLMQWPKVTSGVEIFEEALRDVMQGSPVPWDRLFQDLLGDRRRLVPPATSPHAAAAPRAPPAAVVADHGSSGRPPRGSSAEKAGSDPGQPGLVGAAAAALAGGHQAAPAEAPPGEVSICVGAREPPTGGDRHVQSAGADGLCASGACSGGPPGDAGSGVAASSPGTGAAGPASEAGFGVCGRPGASGASGARASAALAPAEVLGAVEAETGTSRNAQGVAEYDRPFWEKNLGHITSGRFVEAVESPFGLYGTRSQEVLVVWQDGSAEARERHLHPDGQWRETVVTFKLGRRQQQA